MVVVRGDGGKGVGKYGGGGQCSTGISFMHHVISVLMLLFYLHFYLFFELR